MNDNNKARLTEINKRLGQIMGEIEHLEESDLPNGVNLAIDKICEAYWEELKHAV